MGSGEPSLHLGVRDGEAEFAFVTRAGLRSPASFHAGELAVLEHVVAADPVRLLVVGETYGAVGIPATTVAEDVVMAPFRARARDLCVANVRENHVVARTELIARPSDVSGSFDTVGYAPREYVPNTVVAQRCLDALATLDDDGVLFMAARPDAGGSAHVRTLSEYASVEEVGTNGSVRVHRIEKPGGFDPPTLVDRSAFRVTVADTELTLVSTPGLFSAGSLDSGTRLLIDTLDAASNEAVLDLGCGYGPIGAYTASHGAMTVMTDDSRPATVCAEATVSANDLTATVETADGLGAVRGNVFDLVASNPPTHAGDAVLESLFGDITTVLDPGGRIRIVHHQSLDLTPHLDTGLDAVRTVARGDEHEVLGARHPV